MKRLCGMVLVALISVTQGVSAQNSDVAWVQVEARPNLTQAQDRARAYGARLPDVSGFALAGGWYGIVLGPYSRRNAQEVLRVYRGEGTIPRDSFVAFSDSFRQQFWPVGANVLSRGVIAPPTAVVPGETVPDEPVVVAEPEPLTPAGETVKEARRSERDLTADDRKLLQTALKWAGFYNAAIDGAYGRGTRNSMAGWQEANNFEATGVLTTLQRAALLDQYNAVLAGMDLTLKRDNGAGIEMLIPTGVVAFEKYEPPFAHYGPTGDIDARVLLISQAGDQATLFGLYDIMQTLEIVPLDGARERKKDSFVLTGKNEEFISHTQASLQDGEIKGFTLIWPAGDEDRRTRVLDEMQASFTRVTGVLDAAAGNAQDQPIDLVAGLQVRKPRLSRSGFFADASGVVITTAEAVQNCTRITLDQDTEADVVITDTDLGIAVLRPTQPLSPISIARFSQNAPRLQSEVAVSGFSFEGVLDAPSMTFGKLAELRGLRGEQNLTRLALSHLPGDAGGPVFDTGGGVMGMLLPRANGDRSLPDDVSFAANSTALRTVLDSAGVASDNLNDPTPQMAPEDLGELGANMTVLVSCWE